MHIILHLYDFLERVGIYCGSISTQKQKQIQKLQNIFGIIISITPDIIIFTDQFYLIYSVLKFIQKMYEFKNQHDNNKYYLVCV